MNRKSNTQRTKNLARRKFLGLAALAPVALTVTRASAQDQANPPASMPHMGTVGVSAGQMLRVSVFNHGSAQTPGAPDLFKIEVFGLDGNLLADIQGACLPETGAFADFDVAAGLKKPERVQVHIHVTVLADHAFGATAEVFDARTGATRIPDGPCITPLPDPRMAHGSVGLIRGQLMRVSVFHEPGQGQIPCSLFVCFVDLDGKMLATHGGKVLPGQGFAVDWGDGFAGFPSLKVGERFQVHVDVHAEHPHEIGATIEVYDPKTGETQIPDAPCQMPLEV